MAIIEKKTYTSGMVILKLQSLYAASRNGKYFLEKWFEGFT